MGQKSRVLPKGGTGKGQEPSTSQILNQLKTSWRNGAWEDARLNYYTWTNRTGRTRDPLLEAEMLFRAASAAFRSGNYDRAISLLEESSAKHPGDSNRQAACRALCLARRGKLRESAVAFLDKGDGFHALTVSHLFEKGMKIPAGTRFDDPAFESTQLFSFWRSLPLPDAEDPASVTLKNIRRAYHALLRGEQPDIHLEKLSSAPGCGRLAVDLLLIAAVALRRSIRVRNLLNAHAAECRDGRLLPLLDAHLLLLLKEREYGEVETLEGIFDALALKPPRMDRVRDERLFADGLRKVEEGMWQDARERFHAVKRRTPALMHNLALVLQKMERFSEANLIWIPLLKAGKKPKPSDPEDTRLEYTTAARLIAANYLAEDDFSNAVPFLKDAHALSPGDAGILEDLAGASLRIDANADALTYSRKLYGLDPRNEMSILVYAQALLRSRRTDLLCSLFDEKREQLEGDSLTARLLTDIFTHVAWEIRGTIPSKALEMAGCLEKVVPGDPFLIGLQGHFSAVEGKRKNAAKNFDRLIKESVVHSDQFLFSVMMYEDGFREHSLRMFEKILECQCDESPDFLERIAEFLVHKDDREAAMRVFSYAVEDGGISLYETADILLDADRPFWAKEFSLRMMENPDADEDDHFLHLLILNACADAAGTLAFAQLTKKRFEAGDVERGFIWILNDVIGQIKRKGRAKIPYGRG